jgi:hypothetical protein
MHIRSRIGLNPQPNPKLRKNKMQVQKKTQVQKKPPAPKKITPQKSAGCFMPFLSLKNG